MPTASFRGFFASVAPAKRLNRKLFSLDRNDFTSVVSSASLAGSVGQTIFAALGACYEAGHVKLPVGASSLVTSCLRYFILWNRHVDTSLVIAAHRALIYKINRRIYPSKAARGQLNVDQSLFCSGRVHGSDPPHSRGKDQGNFRCKGSCCPDSGQR